MDKNPSNEVKEVLNYMDALSYGFEQITTHNRPLSTKLIKELHTILLTGTRGKDKNPGNFRKYKILLVQIIKLRTLPIYRLKLI